MQTRIHLSNIFISHSRRDEDILTFFDKIFAGLSISATRVEFEDFTGNSAELIKQKINWSSALFVLLGPNIEITEYTKNWVAFEIGLAAAWGKAIWVFEPADIHVQFPIPYLNHYVIYHLNDDKSRRYIKSIVVAYEQPFSKPLPTGIAIAKCPNDNCQSAYRIHTQVQFFQCPTCRQPVEAIDSDSRKGENSEDMLNKKRMGWR